MVTINAGDSSPTKIAIKLGDAEFSAEGPASVVNAQFNAFLKALEAGSAGAPVPKSEPKPKPEPVVSLQPINGELLDRVFSMEKTGVSLKVLPSGGKPDALVLLLYAFRRLRSEDSVTGSALMTAATRSGVQIDRVDREIAPRAELITSAGLRRGKRYGLNNRGLVEAEKILSAILG
jgi:hypothetical protein